MDRIRAFALCAVFLPLLMGCPDNGGISTRLDGAVDLVGSDLPGYDVPLAEGAICQPGATQCVGSHFLTCKMDGSDWTVVTCETGTSCTLKGCVETLCRPNLPACDKAGKVIVCLPDGSGYGAPFPCKDKTVCVAGQCLPEACEEGQKECAQSALLVCQGKPPAWVEVPCGKGRICFKGDCVECFSDDQCPDGMSCKDGHCTTPTLTFVTKELPDGQVNVAYDAALEVLGGTPPYAFKLDVGNLPPGVDLSSDGKLHGTPTTKGVFEFTALVTDKPGSQASAALSITIHDQGLTIVSKSPLPDAEDGTEYKFSFKALGGTPPYGWMVLSGSLPIGLSLSSSGVLTGIPADHGKFLFTVRAVDVGEPISSASAPFEMTVKVAPLRIVGDQSVDLFLTKAVILPLITIVEGIPIPYGTQLQAKGGVKPYAWAEQELPGVVKSFIPKAGVPTGLTLSKSGQLSGSVTSTSEVVEVKVPFINLTLKGFFFFAKVTDAQNPPDSDQAIFLIPTVPVNLGGGGLPF